VSGTAQSGIDYEELPGFVWVAIGYHGAWPHPAPDEPTEYIDIVPIRDGLVEGDETVVVTLAGGQSAQVVIADGVPPELQVTAASDTIDIGETVQCTAVLMYPDDMTEDVTGQVEWCCADPDVASVDAGLVTGESAGATEITATFDDVTSNAVALSVAEAAAALQWWAILVIVLAVLAAGLAFYLFAIRRKQILQR
jgi:hypothetical protein